MIIEDCDSIKLEEGREYCLPKKERERFGKRTRIIQTTDRIYFLTEEEWNRVKPVETRIGLHKAAGRRMERISVWARIDSRGRVSIPVYMRHKKRAR